MMQNKQLEQEWHFLENLDFWVQALSLNASEAATFSDENYREKTAAYYDNQGSFNLKARFNISDVEESGTVALALIHHLEFADIAPMLKLFIDNYHQRRYPGSDVFFGNVVMWFIDTLRFVIDHVHSEQEKSRFSLLMQLDVLMPAGGKQAAVQRDFWLKALTDDTVYRGVERFAEALKSKGFQRISCVLWDYQRILDLAQKLAAGKKDISGEDIDGLLDKDKERAFLDPTAKRYFDLMQNDEDLDNVADLDSSTKELLRMMRKANKK